MYEPVIGLEVHIQLKTRTKAFCGCSTEFGKEPNSQVCPVCLGFPGSLPVLNKTALEYAVRAGLALNCSIQHYTKFDRKHYFYPDLPKAYQISQYDLPVCAHGRLDIVVDGTTRSVGITRVHLEEDAGKLLHKDAGSLVDYNRAGIPLLEIVSEPQIYSPQEAYVYLTVLKSVIQYLDISDCDMEKGTLRCDANVSIRHKGSRVLGTKTELKNLNSFKAVRDALAFEITRQTDVLERGGNIIQETRLWDAQQAMTSVMRTKEGAQDYRYFPEPDLPPFIIERDAIEHIRAVLPELPDRKARRFVEEYGLSEYDAQILVMSRQDASYAEECMKAFAQADKKPIVNWLIGPLLFEANNRGLPLCGLKLPPAHLIELIGYLRRDEISNLAAKSVLTQMLDTGRDAASVIKEKNLIQISDAASLDGIIQSVIAEHARSAADFKAGKAGALMFLIGQVMKKSGGKANPKVVGDFLKRRLNDA